ncbi:MAG: nucleoside monophosphate kinase [bacterium]
MSATPQPSILILGPTGAGKTPLGQLLASRGLWGVRCHHFDFGSELRRIAASRRPPAALSSHDLKVVRMVLASGTLLNERQFGIALKTLKWFLSTHRVKPQEIMILNGMPRHVGQAIKVERTLDVRLVIFLSCKDANVVRRIAGNTGGDRTGRLDDNKVDVAARLEVFRNKTLPLLAHYKQKRVPVKRFRVEVDTDHRDTWQRLQKAKLGERLILRSGGLR